MIVLLVWLIGIVLTAYPAYVAITTASKGNDPPVFYAALATGASLFWPLAVPFYASYLIHKRQRFSIEAEENAIADALANKKLRAASHKNAMAQVEAASKELNADTLAIEARSMSDAALDRWTYGDRSDRRSAARAEQQRRLKLQTSITEVTSQRSIYEQMESVLDGMSVDEIELTLRGPGNLALDPRTRVLLETALRNKRGVTPMGFIQDA